MIQIDRRHFLASLGGAAAVKLMTPEAKAEALESYMMAQLNGGTPASTGTPSKNFPKAADIEAQIETRNYRRGVGNLFLTTTPGGKVKKLQAMPAKPTFLDFFKLRMDQTSNHVLQSANRAMKTTAPIDSAWPRAIGGSDHATARARCSCMPRATANNHPIPGLIP